jgi:hypothetical protein
MKTITRIYFAAGQKDLPSEMLETVASIPDDFADKNLTNDLYFFTEILFREALAKYKQPKIVKVEMTMEE